MPSLKFVLLIMCISLVTCDDRATWRKHMNLVSEKSYPCKVPQPRVLYIEDLVDVKIWGYYEVKIENIIPSATILHRCESTGCCNDRSERCLPKTIEKVELTFGIPQPKALKYFVILVKNHTECSCQRIASV